MAILIEGMEMSTEGGTICVYKISGKFFAARAGKDELFPIIPIPEPHGRLIDADALCASHKEVCSRSMKFNLDLAPTVIPASEEAE